jgi:heptose I phosphotransferase
MVVDLRDRLHRKQGRAIARWTLRRGDDRFTVFLKRHFRHAPLVGFLATIFPWRRWSDAGREAANLRWADAAGFSVPHVAGWGERVGPRGQLQSYLAVEELAGMTALHEAIPAASRSLSPAEFLRWKRGLVAALAGTVGRLHRLRRFHKDLYLCHFFIPTVWIRCPPLRWREPTMIDLHRLSRHRWTGFWWQWKDLAQLLYSSEIEGVTARDRLRFAHVYAGNRRHAIGWRLVRWAVGIRWRNYRRHNASRDHRPESVVAHDGHRNNRIHRWTPMNTDARIRVHPGSSVVPSTSGCSATDDGRRTTDD